MSLNRYSTSGAVKQPSRIRRTEKADVNITANKHERIKFGTTTEFSTWIDKLIVVSAPLFLHISSSQPLLLNVLYPTPLCSILVDFTSLHPTRPFPHVLCSTLLSVTSLCSTLLRSYVSLLIISSNLTSTLLY
jgi:hypothetical protein